MRDLQCRFESGCVVRRRWIRSRNVVREFISCTCARAQGHRYRGFYPCRWEADRNSGERWLRSSLEHGGKRTALAQARSRPEFGKVNHRERQGASRRSLLHCERQGASRRFFLTIRLAPRLHHRLPYPRAAIRTNSLPNIVSGKALAAGSSLHCERQGASRRFFLTIRLAPRLHHRLPYPRAAFRTNSLPNIVSGKALAAGSSLHCERQGASRRSSSPSGWLLDSIIGYHTLVPPSGPTVCPTL